MNNNILLSPTFCGTGLDFISQTFVGGRGGHGSHTKLGHGFTMSHGTLTIQGCWPGLWYPGLHGGTPARVGRHTWSGIGCVAHICIGHPVLKFLARLSVLCGASPSIVP